MTNRSLLLVVGLTLGTFTLDAQPAVQEFRAELMTSGASSPGRLIVAGDQIVFLRDTRPADSFFVPRANVQTVTPDGETIAIQLREPVRDATGELLRFTFHLVDASAASAVAAWHSRGPSIPVGATGESARSSPDPEVRSYAARHKKRFGGSRGRLLVTNTGLAYESIDDVNASRRWEYKDIQELKLKNPYELEMKSFGGDDYTFAIEGQGMDKPDYDALVTASPRRARSADRYTGSFTMKKLAALFLCACAAAVAQSPAVAFTGARIIPIAGPEISDGVLVIAAGKIVSAGPSASTPIPAGAQRVDARGKVIMPGLVDSHSHIGGPEGGDASNAIQPDVRILDSLNVRAASIQRAQAGGLTTVNVMPGSGHLLSGQTLYLKLRDGKTIDDLLITDNGRIAGGMKMANGTNSRGATAPFPGTRAKSASLVREQYVKAQEYRDKVKDANGDRAKLPPRDLRMEGLVEVLEGKRTVHFHSHRHDDILTALRLAKEFGFKLVLQHVSDGWMVADEIAKAGVPCSVIMIDSPGGKVETKDVRFDTPVALDKAGALVGFHTDDGVTDSRFFLRSAGLAVRAGMPREKALYAMTMANARMLDLDRRVGSLEPGKDADFILLSGDPLSVYSHVLETWVEGQKVFDRSVPKDRTYAVGGYGATHDDGIFDFHSEETRQ